MPPAYVGITGFKRREQVQTVYPAHLGDKRKLMVGVLASYRTLIEADWNPEGRSPHRDHIADIFLPEEQFLNLVHYHTADQMYLELQLERAIHYGGPNSHGLQLNVDWPEPRVLKGLRHSFPGKQLVIQLGGRFWPLTKYSPDRLAHKAIATYGGLVDYFLLDTSGGLGKELDPLQIAKYLESLADIIEEEQWPIGLSVAGGLCSSNLHLVRELCGMFHGLSLDAEGRLHDDSGQLDLVHCGRYLMGARQLPV